MSRIFIFGKRKILLTFNKTLMNLVNPIKRLIFTYQAIITYLIVGSITAAVVSLTFALLWNKLHFNYLVAMTIAYILAIITHFFGNRFFTFKKRSAYLLSQITKYLVLISINYLLTIIIMYHSINYLLVSPNRALLLSLFITTLNGYFLSKYGYLKITIQT